MEEQTQQQPKRIYQRFGLLYWLFGLIYFLILPILFTVLDSSPDRWHCPSGITKVTVFLFTPPVSFIVLIVMLIIALIVIVLRNFSKYKNHPSIILLYKKINIITILVMVVLFIFALFIAQPLEFVPGEGWISPC
ncbi:MAG: hypothetical protein ABIB97_02295 [Patescibacteria group bacterium]